MKKKQFILFVTTMLIAVSCTSDYENPNAVTGAEALSQKKGLLALAVGIRQYYAVTA